MCGSYLMILSCIVLIKHDYSLNSVNSLNMATDTYKDDTVK
jgi:hypothetical protein